MDGLFRLITERNNGEHAQSIATSRGFPAELGKHHSNVLYEKKMPTPLTIPVLKSQNCNTLCALTFIIKHSFFTVK